MPSPRLFALLAARTKQAGLRRRAERETARLARYREQLFEALQRSHRIRFELCDPSRPTKYLARDAVCDRQNNLRPYIDPRTGRSDRNLWHGARLTAGVELGRLLDIYRDRRALRGGEVERTKVLPLRRGRLVSDQRVHERAQVLLQLLVIE